MRVPSLGREDPLELPTPVFLPGESHGQRSLAGKDHEVTKSWARLKQFCMHPSTAITTPRSWTPSSPLKETLSPGTSHSLFTLSPPSGTHPSAFYLCGFADFGCFI